MRVATLTVKPQIASVITSTRQSGCLPFENSLYVDVNTPPESLNYNNITTCIPLNVGNIPLMGQPAESREFTKVIEPPGKQSRTYNLRIPCC